MLLESPIQCVEEFMVMIQVHMPSIENNTSSQRAFYELAQFLSRQDKEKSKKRKSFFLYAIGKSAETDSNDLLPDDKEEGMIWPDSEASDWVVVQAGTKTRLLRGKGSSFSLAPIE